MFHKKLKQKVVKRCIIDKAFGAFYLFIYLFVGTLIFFCSNYCFVQLKKPCLLFTFQRQCNYLRMMLKRKSFWGQCVVLEWLNGDWARVQFWVRGPSWVGGHFYVLFFLYIKSSFSLLFVAFLMKQASLTGSSTTLE